MPIEKYDLVDDHGNPIAFEMDFETICILLKALMKEYYAEEEISYTVRRHVYPVSTSEVDVMKKTWETYADQLKSE